MGSALQVLTALFATVAIFLVGFMILRTISNPLPPPPPPGELRKVKITYRCSLCGAEAKMTVAPTEDPEAPRHCMEDMDLVAPISE